MIALPSISYGGRAAAPAAGDPDFANTVLLLSGDGANGSTTFTDESAAARGNATVAGNARVTTGTKKFGTGSILFDGGADDISYASHADWNLPGDFTIDAWCNFNAGGIETAQAIVSRYRAGVSQRCWLFQYSGHIATNALVFAVSADGIAVTSVLSHNWTPTADTFYLLSVDRSGNVWRMYIDGVMVAKATNAIVPITFAQPLRIGRTNDSTVDFNGFIDDIRITKNTARYASDAGFSVPTAAFPRS